MEIQMFNFWYFFWIFISISVFFELYFILRKKSERTKKRTLFGILLFALLLHFLKCFIPPYSTDILRLYRDIWFINICAANILLFPFIFIGKNKTAKDYMFYIGLLSGIISLIIPLEPINKINQQAEILDIIRFYIHHSIIWIVPLLMIVLKLHTIDYKNILKIPGCLMLVLLFIMLNQVFQSELGFIPLRGDDLLNVNYKNSSYIWGTNNDTIGQIIASMCPSIFKTVPVGDYAGELKYWPWFWLIVPAHIVLIPMTFLISLLVDFKSIKEDFNTLKNKIKHFKLVIHRRHKS